MASSPACPRSAHAIIVLLLAAASHASAAPDESFFHVAYDATPGQFDVHKDEAVWASPGTAGTDLVVTNLTTMENEVATSIPSGSRLLGLDFDGRWITWIDDRFGTPDLFVVDSASGSLTRVTRGGLGDVEVAIADGHLAWTRSGELSVRDLATGTEQVIETGPGQARQPAVTDERLFWVRIDAANNTRTIVSAGLSGQDAGLLAPAAGSFHYSPVASGERVAWIARTLLDADRPDAGFAGSTVQSASWRNGTYQNISQPLARVLDASVSREHVAWIAPSESGNTAVWCELDTADCQALQTESSQIRISDSHLLLLEATGAYGTLYAREWEPAAADKESPWPPVAALAAVAGAAALLRARRD